MCVCVCVCIVGKNWKNPILLKGTGMKNKRSSEDYIIC